MGKEQRDKKVYCLAGIVGILGIFFLIGVWPNCFENEVKKDKAYLALRTKTETSQPPAVKSRAHNVSQPKQCRIDVNAIYSLVLLGVAWWLYHDCAKQLSTSKNSQEMKPSLQWRHAHYILAAVVLLAMFGYVGYFFYQNYSLNSTCAKDMAILLLVMPLFFEIITYFMDILLSEHPVIWLLCSNVIYYYFGRWWLSITLSNNKLVLLKQGWSSYTQYLLSTCMLAYIYAQTYNIELDEGTAFIGHWLLWCIPLAFLDVQAYWSPQLCFSSGHEKIDYLIAWPFWTSNLWLALGFTELYDRKLDGRSISGLVLLWLCISYYCWPPGEKVTIHSHQA